MERDTDRTVAAVDVAPGGLDALMTAVTFAVKLDAAGESVADRDPLHRADRVLTRASLAPDGDDGDASTGEGVTVRLDSEERRALVAAGERFLEEVGGDRAAALRTALDALEAAGGTPTGGAGDGAGG